MALRHFDEESFQEALVSNQLMMVDFWATWCGPCQMLGPVIEQLAEEYEEENVVIGKVDVDENPAVAQRYGVMSIPTVIFFKEGEEFDRKVGTMSFEAYADTLDEALEEEE
ncbi:MAG: thioredoxin [Oscillospiraceae bacterium]|nr:thioredoxin [Oscillospiraceae bacterium]